MPAASTATAGPVLRTLRAARKLLSNPKRWTKGWFAKDASGQDASSLELAACSWCAYGALERSCGTASGPVLENSARLLRESLRRSTGIAAYNDHPRRRHADVLRLFDRAILKAKKLGV